ncbi:MAG: NrfD/PsrC family molybdoenzyme membrane anchor subunit [Solirubrobacteraceae bacterium]
MNSSDQRTATAATYEDRAGDGRTGPPTSYYNQPVIKEPVWTWEIPCYFFTGGLAGASAGLAYLAELRANELLARRAWTISFAAVSASPVLLIMDLGQPMRFLNMLRMFKITSPMSVGSWLLSVSAAATTAATLHALTGRLPRSSRAARPMAALLGLPLSTYTAALVANTAVPVWHEARRELPFLFAAGAAASAGAGAAMATSPAHAALARRLALAGAGGELAAMEWMQRSLGDIGAPYHEDEAERFARLARGLTAAGAGVLLLAGRRWRGGAATGGALIMGGALAGRFSVFRAGFQSARDPQQVNRPQRERIRSGASRGAAIRHQPSGAN